MVVYASTKMVTEAGVWFGYARSWSMSFPVNSWHLNQRARFSETWKPRIAPALAGQPDVNRY